ncbi:hypothetical protein ACWZHB_09320 [Nocardia sp. FBN12]|uniref:hypothetical protein n=1 Tax=Nocardia sp. FBN12 TaxID=3419766 RepID=UPI003D006D7D
MWSRAGPGMVAAARFSVWIAGLGDRANVDIRTYPACDHLFFPGDTPAVPADYARPQHVDGEVVADIAQWITAR